MEKGKETLVDKYLSDVNVKQVFSSTQWYKQKGWRRNESSVLHVQGTLPVKSNAKALIPGRNKGSPVCGESNRTGEGGLRKEFLSCF